MINTCVFSSESVRVLISVGQDRTLRVWDLRNRQPKNLSITSVAIGLDLNKLNTYFATGHKSGDVKLWSLSEQKQVKKASHLHASPITSLKFVPNGTQIASSSRSNGVLIIDASSMDTIH